MRRQIARVLLAFALIVAAGVSAPASAASPRRPFSLEPLAARPPLGTAFGHRSALPGAVRGTGIAGCTITGTSGNDIRLEGTSADDVICGLGGSDQLVGYGGNDTLIGGNGFDFVSYDVAAAGVAVNLAAGTGTDGGGGNDTYDSVEGIVGSDGSDTLVGDDNANEIYPLAGDDVVAAGGRFDYVRFDFSDSPVVVNLGGGTASGEGLDTLSGVEGVVLTRFGDRATGDAGVNWFYGLGRADKLFGMGGADRFHAAAGNDRMEGDAGNDDFFGGAGHDTCIQGRGGGTMESC